MEVVIKDKTFQKLLKDAFLVANYNILYEGKRKLSSYKLVEYINNLKYLIDKQFIQMVIDLTLYVPDEILTLKLETIANEFIKNNHHAFYILLNNKKFSSSELMLIKLSYLLENENFCGFILANSVLPENSQILIINDCGYLGNNLLHQINILSNNNPSILIHILIPYLSNAVIKELSKCGNLKMYNPQILKDVNEYLESIGQSGFSNKIFKRFNLTNNFNIPIYFDHKVSKYSFGSIYLDGLLPQNNYYGKLIKYKPDENVINYVWSKFFQHLLPENIYIT